MDNVTTVGIDLAKNVFSLHGVDERAKRIQALSGIGPISASAPVASVADAHEFSSGGQFAAWLALTPKQFSTGGKTRLGRITAHGDPYLRTLLIMGARSMLQNASRRTDRLARRAIEGRARGLHLGPSITACSNEADERLAVRPFCQCPQHA